jgi:hypothetical protein
LDGIQTGRSKATLKVEIEQLPLRGDRLDGKSRVEGLTRTEVLHLIALKHLVQHSGVGDVGRKERKLVRVHPGIRADKRRSEREPRGPPRGLKHEIKRAPNRRQQDDGGRGEQNRPPLGQDRPDPVPQCRFRYFVTGVGQDASAKATPSDAAQPL